MLNKIVHKVKTRLAQHTRLFDLSTESVEITTQANVIKCNLEGEYTLSGAADGIASAGCLNDTHTFSEGQVITDFFFGNEEQTLTLTASKLNVGTAYRRETAIEAVTDPNSENCCIVYVANARSNTSTEQTSISQDQTLKVQYTIGALFKIKAKQVDTMDLLGLDKLFIFAGTGATKSGANLVQFSNINERFLSGDSYVVDLTFSYTEDMHMTEAFLAELKHFEAQLSSVTT